MFFRKFVCYTLAFCVLIFGFCFCVNSVNRKIYPLYYKEQVIKYSALYGVDSALVFATIKVESNFDYMAKSRAGAIGLMQIKESTGEYIANMLKVSEYDLYNPTDNVRFGVFYLKYLLDKFNCLETAVCAYNAGEGKVSLWLNNSEYSDDGLTLKHIPYVETKVYLEKIKKTFIKYNKLYENILDK